MSRVAATVVLLLALAQRGGFRDFGGFDQYLTPARQVANVPYDGRFAFVRLSYQTLPGGYWYRGQPAWSHGYPTSEENLMQILMALTCVSGNQRTNVLSMEDRRFSSIRCSTSSRSAGGR